MALRRHERNVVTAKTESTLCVASHQLREKKREKEGRPRDSQISPRNARKAKRALFRVFFTLFFKIPRYCIHKSKTTSITSSRRDTFVYPTYLFNSASRRNRAINVSIRFAGYSREVIIQRYLQFRRVVRVRTRRVNGQCARTSKISPANDTPCPARRARNNQLENYALIG